jgi:hypothetical protein
LVYSYQWDEWHSVLDHALDIIHLYEGATMSEDPRCCGTGTCIINADGVCWCGQVWDGEKMCRPKTIQSDGMAEDIPTVDTPKE